jgi:hypothetical protein
MIVFDTILVMLASAVLLLALARSLKMPYPVLLALAGAAVAVTQVDVGLHHRPWEEAQEEAPCSTRLANPPDSNPAEHALAFVARKAPRLTPNAVNEVRCARCRGNEL